MFSLFFFKQKTAYDMRISDWSSDVCSSDLQWLIAEGLADEHDGRTTYHPGMIAALQRRELLRVAGQLSDELELPFVETKAGDRIDGRFSRAIEMVRGRHALIERSRDFTLGPWPPGRDRPVARRRGRKGK